MYLYCVTCLYRISIKHWMYFVCKWSWGTDKGYFPPFSFPFTLSLSPFCSISLLFYILPLIFPFSLHLSHPLSLFPSSSLLHLPFTSVSINSRGQGVFLLLYYWQNEFFVIFYFDDMFGVSSSWTVHFSCYGKSELIVICYW